ncbi:head decoration protein [Thiocapsa sp. UBA6158]|jgi:hypothetical protein|uniref:head decoration protein n=1 Tax=Thiocapsa sp. UBA6158 TaxID=1947692 RepID=UPI0025FAB709|nr:head decoration protein [Thiocapsa sp. UBA6158]
MSEDYGQTSVAIPADDILGEGFPLLPQQIVLAASQGALVRGTVLGLITVGAAVAAKVSGTGDGDVAAAAVTLGKYAQPGVYTLVCTAESAGAGTFSVQTPRGEMLKPLTVAAGYASDHINLTVPDGANDWDVGDVITVTVAAGSGQAKAYSAAAVDGSQVAALILADSVTVGDDALAAVAFRTGVFRRAKLTGLDAAATAQLDARSIFVR